MHVELVIKKGDVVGRRVGRYLHYTAVPPNRNEAHGITCANKG